MSTTTLALTGIFLSTILAFFSNSWLTIWILLELNTLSFCSIMFKKTESNAYQTKESLMKYLIIQILASALLVMTGILKETQEFTTMSISLIMVMALMVKMAAAPFHYWFISVSKKNSWNMNKILFTWQKLLPMYLIIFQPKKMIFPFVAVSALVGAIFMMNKKSFKEILALSSIFNLSWMLTAIVMSLKMMLTFSIIYWISLVVFMKEIIKDMTSTFDEKNSQLNKMSLMMKTINLAGIPPLMLFTVKWMTFSHMLKLNMLTLPSLILILSSVNIFIYLRMSTATLIAASVKEQKNKMSKPSHKETMFILMNLLVLQTLL